MNTAWRVLAKNPGATLLDVAAEANVGRATIYRHFPSREHLIRSLAMTAFEDMKSVLYPIYEENLSGRESLVRVIQEMVPKGDRYHFLWNELSIYEDGDVQRSYLDLIQRFSGLVDKAKSEGVIDPTIPIPWVSSVLDSLIWSAWLTVEEGYIARRDAPALVIRSFFRGMAPA